MKDLTDFTGKLAKGFIRAAEKTIIDVIKNAGEKTVTATPKDTGAAQANWQAAINTRPSDAIKDAAGGADAAIQSIKQEAGQYKIGATFFLVNNLEYVERLNRGSSKQAPSMFIEKALQKALEEANFKW